jgi:hypothetical protein
MAMLPIYNWKFNQKQLPQQLGSSEERQKLLYLMACASSCVRPVPASLNREFTLKIVGND